MKLSIFVLCIFVLMTETRAEFDPFTEIRNLGFNPSSTKPADFSAQMAEGGEQTLSDYKGKWIMLAFWATWCGPCQYELPILEKLHQSLKDKGLVILGISIDKEGKSKEVQKFLKNKKISFPNFLDPQNKIAGRYFANAVPSIYLISPDWKLVGIARGARDWSDLKIKSSFERLLPIKEVKENKMVADNSFSLPENLIPPVLKSVLSKASAQVGEKFSLDIFIQWQGRLEQYLFKVPKPHLPTIVDIGSVSSESFERDGVALLKYSYPLTVNEPGTYTIGPIEMEYKSRLGGGFQATRAPGKIMTINPFALKKWIFGLLGLLVIIMGILVFRKKTGTKEIITEKNGNLENLKKEWSETKRRVEKNSWESGEKSAQLILLKFAIKAHQELGLSFSELEKTLNQVQFANMSISTSQMNIISKGLDNSLREN